MDAIRFKNGDEVFAAQVHWRPVERPCPDCLGKLFWTVTLPNGESWTVDCPRCLRGGAWDQRAAGVVQEEYDWVAGAERGVVNGVRFDTTRESGKQVEYTFQGSYTPGVGGSIHYDRDLFATRGEALDAANARAVVRKTARDEEEAGRAKRKRKPKSALRSTAGAEHEEAPDTLRSVAYARSQVRKAETEIARWIEFAARHGTTINRKELPQ